MRYSEGLIFPTGDTCQISDVGKKPFLPVAPLLRSLFQDEGGCPVTERILVVDDNGTILKNISRLLTEEGYEVEHAANGAQALKLLAEHTFRLVLSDVFMPEMTGYQLLDQVRARFSNTRIILMTSSLALKGTHREADGYIAKPFELEELLQAISTVLATPTTGRGFKPSSSAAERDPHNFGQR